MEPNFHYLPKEITNLVKQRKTLDNETLCLLYRELEAVSRLLSIEIFYNKQRKSIRQLVLHQMVNYLQTPEHSHGLLPPVEVSLELSYYYKSEEVSIKSSGESDLILNGLEW